LRQREKSKPYSESKPSEVREVYWIYAIRMKGHYPKPTARSGKWLLFVNRENVDETWAMIKTAVEEGKLGDSAKVATAKASPLRRDAATHVICIYTYDWTDREDVARVRSELRKIGVSKKIPYKTDEDTLAGKYRVHGDRRISKYYE
jgi:hypothetical protein